MLFGIIATANGKVRITNQRYWSGLAYIFLFMDMDEATTIHETLIEPIRALLDLLGLLYFSWVIVGLIFLITLFIYYLPFYLSLNKRLRLNFFISGFVYILGAIFVEMVSGDYASQYGVNNLPYKLIASLEESLEILGILLLIRTLLMHISREASLLTLKIENINGNRLI